MFCRSHKTSRVCIERWALGKKREKKEQAKGTSLQALCIITFSSWSCALVLSEDGLERSSVEFKL